MKIVVIGSTGLIGSCIYNKCIMQKIEVLGTSTTGGNGMIKYNLADDSKDLITQITSDYNDETYAVITAAVTKISECEQYPIETRKINVCATVDLINRLDDAGVRSVFLSSDAVYDGTKGNYSEDDMVNPINEYGRQKADVEQYCKENIRNAMILRLSKQYDSGLGKRHLVSDIYSQARDSQAVKCIRGLRFNPTYMGDTASCIIECCRKGLSGVYHLASPRSMSRHDVALQILDRFVIPKGIIEDVSQEELNLSYRVPLNVSMNVSKLDEALGYRFKNLDEVLMDMGDAGGDSNR